ncbi:MAG: MFS transporter [Carbonactinosporaceae bacterium]
MLCLSLLIIGLDNTVLNVALPTLQRDLDASAADLQWVVDGYTLAVAGLLLTAGSWGDAFGRKRALDIGLLVFGAASAWGAFCTTPWQLITARTLMGVGGALIMPSTLSILTSIFTSTAERRRAIGIWAGVSGLGVAIGPALGGWLLEHFWWGTVLLINLPIVVIALVAGAALMPESRSPAGGHLDLPGALLSIGGLVALVGAIIEAPDSGWTDPRVLAAFGAAAVLLAGFAWWELRTAHPMLDIRFFRDTRFSAAAGSVTLVFFALFGSVFFLSIYLQAVLGYDPLAAGLRLVPVAAGLAAGAPLAMWAAQRVGEKIPAVTGLVTLAAGLYVLSGTTVDSGYGRTVGVLTLIGFGMSATMAPATEAVMGALPRSRAGVGSAVNDTTRQVGGALGVAVLGSILNSVYTGRMTDPPVALRPDAAAAAADNVQAALAVSATLPAPAGQELAAAAREAFVAAMHTTVLAGAVIVVLGAVAAALWLPHHGRDT